jgi:mono/diheme cytochrome c family protein
MRMRIFLKHFLAVCVLAPVAPHASIAQTSGAPSLFTADQAARGELRYGQECLSCHGEDLDDGDLGPALRGSDFRTHWGDVAALFSYTKSTMPQNNPGSLTDSDYAAILAFILQSNDYKPGATALPIDPAAQSALKLATGN